MFKAVILKVWAIEVSAITQSLLEMQMLRLHIDLAMLSETLCFSNPSGDCVHT